jgi:hypothetical protein
VVFWAIGRGLLLGLILALQGVRKVTSRSRDEEGEVRVVCVAGGRVRDRIGWCTFRSIGSL